MRAYEGLFIFLPNEAPEVRQTYCTELESLLKRFDGKIVQKEDLGKRSLGYAIRKNQDGSMLNTELQLNPAKMQDLRRALQLTENLLKYMITVKEPEDKRKIEKKKPARGSKPPRPGIKKEDPAVSTKK